MYQPPEDIPSASTLGRFGSGTAKPLMAMVEITNRCNMNCPICYSNASHAEEDIPIEKIEKYLKQLLDVTETPIPIQISGGEPSLRDDLPEIITMTRDLGYKNIELITNGIRIARQPEFLQELAQAGLTAVYLQFDGLQPATTKKIRGQDMSSIRLGAIAATRAADLCCTLAVVVTRGVNDGEIGDIVRFAVENIDVVRAINFQSAARLTGRFDVGEDYQGYDLPELVGLIAEETGIARESFYSEHIGHSSCNAMSPVFIVNGKYEPLFKYISMNDLLEFMSEERREMILGTFSGKKDFFHRYLFNPKAWKLLAKAAPIFGKNPLNVLKSKHLLLFAKAFMEKDALDQKRIENCCYAITTNKGVISFCAYNNLYRPRN